MYCIYIKLLLKYVFDGIEIVANLSRSGSVITVIPTEDISLRRVCLTGGIFQPHIAKSSNEILVDDLNEYEESTLDTVHILTYDVNLSKFEWEYITSFPISRAFHTAFFSQNSIIIMGGVNVENSTVRHGERQGIDPVIINLTSKVVTKVTLLNSPTLSGFSGIQVI